MMSGKLWWLDFGLDTILRLKPITPKIIDRRPVTRYEWHWQEPVSQNGKVAATGLGTADGGGVVHCKNCSHQTPSPFNRCWSQYIQRRRMVHVHFPSPQYAASLAKTLEAINFCYIFLALNDIHCVAQLVWWSTNVSRIQFRLLLILLVKSLELWYLE